MKLFIYCLVIIAMWGCSKQEPPKPVPTAIEVLPVLPDWPNRPSDTQESVDLDKLLTIIYQLESSSGANCEARFEPGFLKRYGNNAPMPELRRLFGDEAAASSYGCYQIMLCVAWENDYRYTPEQLADPINNKTVAEFLVRKYAARYANLPVDGQVWGIAKMYNGSDGYASIVQKLYRKDNQ